MNEIKIEGYLVLNDQNKELLVKLMNDIIRFKPEFMALSKMYSNLLGNCTANLLDYTVDVMVPLANHPCQIKLSLFYDYLIQLERFSNRINVSMPGISITLFNLVTSVKFQLIRMQEEKFK